MTSSARPRGARRAGRRIAAAAAFVLPAVLGAGSLPSAAVVPVDPTPVPSATSSATPTGSPSATPTGTPSATPFATPTATATPTPTPTAAPLAGASIGGPRMAERGLVVAGGVEASPETAAASYVVADADTGQVLAAKDPHSRHRPASTLKTLLALTMLPRLDNDNGTYTADEDDVSVEGTRVGMVEHQTYPLDLLWYGLMLRSGNDAANALAKAGADGDLARAVRMMNAEAARLQALDTTAVNPSGLDADGQYSSAYDLALWGRAALQRGDLRKYMKKLKIVFPGDHTRTSTKKNRKSFDVFTGNRLILRGYDGAIGVKNGYTTLARNTLIAAAERDGRTIIATLMRSPGSIHDDAADLLDWGFANVGSAIPVGVLVDPVSPSVVTGEEEAVTRPDPVGAEHSPTAPVAKPRAAVDVGAADDTASSTPLGLPAPALAAAGTAAALLFCGVAALLSRRRRLRPAPAAAPPASPAPPTQAAPPGTP